MSTALDLTNHAAGQVALASPLPGTTAAALDMLRGHAEMMDMAYNLASKMVLTNMVPAIYRGKDKAEDATAAILYGLELGLNPIQSLQNVFPVHGQPSIYAKTKVALLKAKGYKFETVEAGPASCTVKGWWPGEKPLESTWTIQRAIDAGFVPTIDPETGKYKTKKYPPSNGRSGYEKLIGNEKYLLQPEEMLWAKAASTVCRRLAPDVLLGISHTIEDLESEPAPEPVRVQSERVTAAEVLAEEVPATAPPVREWTPPAPAETEQADEPAAADPAPPAEEPPAKPAKASTRTQQNKVARLLDERGITEAADKLGTIGAFFDRSFASAAELTWDEAIALLAHLEDDPVATAEQVARLGALLDEVGLSEDGAAEERAQFLEAKTGRVIGALAHLTGREVEAIEALIHGTSTATAGGAQ